MLRYAKSILSEDLQSVIELFDALVLNELDGWVPVEGQEVVLGTSCGDLVNNPTLHKFDSLNEFYHFCGEDDLLLIYEEVFYDVLGFCQDLWIQNISLED